MTEPTTEINVEQIRHSGVCGNVDNISETAVPSGMRQETNCTAEGTYQVWMPTEPPEAASIVCACDEHIEEAKEHVQRMADRVESLTDR